MTTRYGSCCAAGRRSAEADLEQRPAFVALFAAEPRPGRQADLLTRLAEELRTGGRRIVTGEPALTDSPETEPAG